MTKVEQSEDRRGAGRGAVRRRGAGSEDDWKKGEEDGVVYGDTQREAEGVPEV